MAESKNNFIKARMNQDLDDRLIPQGEYRVGQNVTISRSEGDGVGTFQNILGNNNLSDFGLTDVTLQIIGYLVEEVNNKLYVFITNYNDSSQDQLSNTAPLSSSNYIIQYDFTTNTSIILVQGGFLNFSKTHRVYGINLVENLLFWTDYRNQPRKINVTTAASDINYYNSEDKISVAKFYPSNCLNFFKETKLKATNTQASPGGTSLTLDVKSSAAAEGLFVGMPVSLGSPIGRNIYLTTVSSINGSVTLSSNASWSANDVIVFSEYGLKNCGDKYLPVIFECTLTLINQAAGTYTLQSSNNSNPILEGWQSNYSDSKLYIASCGQIANIDNSITVNQDYKITNYTGANITIKDSFGNPPPDLNGTTIKIYRENPNYNPNFPGDTQFLKEKFMRFSYRFKFDDNEYSLMAPFTQIAFTPKNFGSFVLNQEELTAKSSVVNFFENNIDCVDLYVKTPFESVSTTSPTHASWNNTFNTLNIKEVEILCKFAGETSVKVVDVLDETFVNSISNNGNDCYFKYTYQSTKPIRVLPEKDITRVYDKTPVRAFSQEVSGNRIMYGNYIDKHTSPLSIDYKLGISNKIDIPLSQDKRVFNNHTLKENRNYQVGIVLSDRYGRQSDVILSSIQDYQDVSGAAFGNSTIYNPFSDDTSLSATDVLNFTGKQLSLYLQNSIPETIVEKGYPGLYSSENVLGWYTYKIVVKQQEQEYYNIYIPSSYRKDSVNYDFKNSYFSLVNDNINKVPKDLENVGPEEKEFRSSVNLFPRVNPTFSDIYKTTQRPPGGDEVNSFFIIPSKNNDEVNSIIYNSYERTTGNNQETVGREVSPSKIFRGNVSTLANVINNSLFGVEDNYANAASWSTLGVYESNPFVSNLDIYYETSTSGFISELNSSILEGDLGPVTLNFNESLSFNEDTDNYLIGTGSASSPQYGTVIYTVELMDKDGVAILSANNTCSLTSAFSTISGGTNIASQFTLVPQKSNNVNTGRFNIYPNVYRYTDVGQNITFNFTATANNVVNNTLSFTGPMSNIQPQYNQQANPTDPSLGDNFIPISIEPYSNYTRLTGGNPQLSLKPNYYASPNNGDNVSAQGIGETSNGFGSLPSVYVMNSNSQISYLNPYGFKIDGNLNQSYFADVNLQPGGGNSYSFINFHIQNQGVFGSGQRNYCTYLLSGGTKDVPSGTTPATQPPPAGQEKYSAIYWWRKLLWGVNNVSGNESYPNSPFDNYPFQSFNTQNIISSTDYDLNLPVDQLINEKFFSLVKYTSSVNSGEASKGPWSILEQNQNVSKFINTNGGVGFLNGTLDLNRYQDDLTYSLSNFRLPTGDILNNPLNPTGTFPDPTGEIASLLEGVITINTSGVINIIDFQFLNYFGIQGTKNYLIKDTYGNEFGGLIINNKLGHGQLLRNVVGSGSRDIGSYGMFWIGYDINVTDSNGFTTVVPINLLTIS